MIRFCCEQCGHKMSVPDESAGKRGKCPKCNNIVIVPDKSAIIELHCLNCGRKISVPKVHAGKKGRCPNCKNIIVIPAVKGTLYQAKQSESVDMSPRLVGNDVGLALLDVPEELKLRNEAVGETGTAKAAVEQEQEEETEENIESVGKRKLPLFIDLLLYPMSSGGLSTIAIITLLKLLTDIATVLLACCICVGGMLGFIIQIFIVYSYMYWYFSECIRDSAEGGLRAPEVLGNMPGLCDMFWQFLRLLACFAFFLGPVAFYRGYTYFSEIEMNSVIFWSLLTYGIFFFPMGTLAVVMFDSVNGLNPVLVIRSIGSTLVRYCFLVVLFYILTILFIFLRTMMMRILPRSGIITSIFSTYITFIFSIYALLVMGHLLGRFYYKYQDKLDWEV